MSQSNFELRRKLLQLEALYDVGRALNTLRGEADLLEELMQRAIAVLDATLGFVVSLDEKLNVQQLFTFGVEEADPGAILREPPIRQLLASRQAMSLTVGTFLGVTGGDLLIAPMIAGDVIVGILGVGGKEERGAASGSFVSDDLRFLVSLAAIGGAAVDNARRFYRLDLMRETLEDENRSLKARMLREYSDRLMVGDSLKMQRVIDLVARVADSQASVLILGESGTGKEMVARLIHGNSPRKDGPFVAINCAALPETLLESELFGIERGVATGVEARPGKFELAKGGTVFLDEIGDVPLTLQSKLLRVLQEREVEKLGGRRRIPIDVRILTATHRNLEEMIERSEFRQDLYYRLRVVEITLPPLRERRDDIPKLVRFFLDKYGKREGLKDVRITQEALQKLMRYPFPGNVRELENLIEGALAVTDDP
ncbi:MAG: sigma 54-interacting transcriptional regulator, partial [Acidobacteriota bacterium]